MAGLYVQVVLSKGVDEGKVLFLSLIAAPEGIHMVCKKFPRVKVITSEIDEGIDESTFQVIPGEQLSVGCQSCRQCQQRGWHQHGKVMRIELLELPCAQPPPYSAGNRLCRIFSAVSLCECTSS